MGRDTVATYHPLLEDKRNNNKNKSIIWALWGDCANNRLKRHDDKAPFSELQIYDQKLDFKTKNSSNIIDNPQYSPDFTPCDFFLFPTLKLSLRGSRFHSIEAIKESSRELR